MSGTFLLNMTKSTVAKNAAAIEAIREEMSVMKRIFDKNMKNFKIVWMICY